jgi:hypothetical protein
VENGITALAAEGAPPAAGSASRRDIRPLTAVLSPDVASGGMTNRGVVWSTDRDCDSMFVMTCTACSCADRACSLTAFTS